MILKSNSNRVANTVSNYIMTFNIALGVLKTTLLESPFTPSIAIFFGAPYLSSLLDFKLGAFKPNCQHMMKVSGSSYSSYKCDLR